MIEKSMMQAMVSLVDDLSRELPDSERYRRLLVSMRALLPCDAAAFESDPQDEDRHEPDERAASDEHALDHLGRLSLTSPSRGIPRRPS